MKRLLPVLLVAFYLGSRSQTAVSIANGNWTNPLTWNCSCVPVNGYSVTISNSVTLNTSLIFTSGGVTISNTGSLIQDASLNRDIWINGGYFNNSGKANFRYLLVSTGSITNPGSFTVTAFTNSVTMNNTGSITMDSMYIAGSFTNAANAKIMGDSLTNASTLINNGHINVTWVTNKGTYKNYDYQGSYAYTNMGTFENNDSLILTASVWNKASFINKPGAVFNMTKNFYNTCGNSSKTAVFDNQGSVKVMDSWYSTDTIKGTNTGTFTVADTSANSGVMKGSFQFCDQTPPAVSPYVDLNSGSIAPTITYCIATGIKEETLSSLQIYPNPSAGTIMIRQQENRSLRATITDLSGKIVHEEIVQGSAYIHADCATGVYLLKLSDAQNGTLIKVEKLLIQK